MDASSLFDAHCHLAPESAAGTENAGDMAAGGRIICGVEPGEWPRLAAVCAGWRGAIAAYGVHPWRAGTNDPAWEDTLCQFLRADPDAWVGEIGLDSLKIADAAPERQTDMLVRQLRIAHNFGRRINLHCVKAWQELIPFLDSDYLSGCGAPGFIVHSFAGPEEFMRALSDRGAFFSVGPLFSRRNSRRDRGRAARYPEDRIVLESDAFLVPGHDAIGELSHTLAWLAEVRNIPEPDMAALVAENTRRLTTHA